MKKRIILFGGIVGSAVIFPACVIGAVTSLMGSIFSRGGGNGAGFILALNLLAMVGSLSSLSMTVVNYVKEENEFKKIMSIFILAAGALGFISLLVVMIDAFHFVFLVGFLASLCVIASGLLQLDLIKID